MLIIQKSLRKSEIEETVLRPLSGEKPYFEEITSIIGELKHEFELDNCTLITALPQEIIVTRSFSFPFSGSDVLRNIVMQEVSEALPLPLEEMIWNIKVIQGKGKSSEVFFAAAGMQRAMEYIGCFSSNGLKPAFIGLESEAINDAVRYTKTDSVINYVHCDIGYSKTVINVIQNGILRYSQSVPNGMSDIARGAAKLFKVNEQIAAARLEMLHLDLESVDANLNTGFYKSLRISKKQLAGIYDRTESVVREIAQHVKSVLQIVRDESDSSAFEKMIISGGISNLRSIADIFYSIAGIPVGSCEILPSTNNRQIQTRFFTVFGLIHSYFDRRERINLADNRGGEDEAGRFSQYYPAVFFSAVSFIITLSILLLSFIFSGSQKAKNEDILRKNFYKLYNVKLEKDMDPIAEAKKLLNEEKKRRESLEVIAPHKKTVMEVLSEITSAFPDSEDFILGALTISESTITINGTSKDTGELETFKNNLNGSGHFESVTLNTNITSNSGTSFTMTIKSKTTKTEADKNVQ